MELLLCNDCLYHVIILKDLFNRILSISIIKESFMELSFQVWLHLNLVLEKILKCERREIQIMAKHSLGHTSKCWIGWKNALQKVTI